MSIALSSWLALHQLSRQIPATHPGRQMLGLRLKQEGYFTSQSRRSAIYLDFGSIRAITPPSVEGLRQSLPKTHGLADVPTTDRLLERSFLPFFLLGPTPQTRSRTFELLTRRGRWRKRNGTSLMV